MERVMSVEDKIRRAEEIYYKRRQQEVPMREMMRKTPTKKNDIRLIKKMIKQIIVCMIIYGIFYLIVNSNYIFSEDFTNKVKEILSQDINFSQVYSVVSNIINNDENIGGAEENLTTVETPDSEIVQEQIPENETSGLSQMEQDANHIKNTISFIKPVNGKISSVFGLRNPTTSTVPKDHKGTDIATETGSKIVSATDGKVVLVSTTGDYGNHLKIQTNDVIIVYAHCNKLYVNEGDIIKQGQEIAEVGSTGNTTGPHLHFEVRYQNRYVDPQLILEL